MRFISSTVTKRSYNCKSEGCNQFNSQDLLLIFTSLISIPHNFIPETATVSEGDHPYPTSPVEEKECMVLTEGGFHNRIDQILQIEMNDSESMDENKTKAASTCEFSSSSILLSLVARISRLACLLRSKDHPHIPLKHSSSPYGIEFTHIPYGCLLTLIDKNKDEFCHSTELLLNSINPNKSENEHAKSSFEKDTDILLPSPSPSMRPCPSSMTNSLINLTNTKLLNAFGQLLSCLTILQSNLTILSDHIIKCNFIYKNLRKIEIEKKSENENVANNLSKKGSDGKKHLIKKSVFDPYVSGI